MRRAPAAKLLFTLAAALMLPEVGHAQSLLVSTGIGTYADNQYGGSRWGQMTGFINTAFSNNVTTAGLIGDSNYLLGFDRLWVDQRLSAPTLSAAELSAIATFAATGRRIVLIGENSNWAAWNNALAGLVGGTVVGPDCGNAALTSVVNNSLTAGAATVTEVCGQAMSGGTSLYTRDLVSLWGANQNILVWLDSNMQEDTQLGKTNNRQFATNVADWLAADAAVVVPEPGTYALVALGLGVIGMVSRRRRVEM